MLVKHLIVFLIFNYKYGYQFDEEEKPFEVSPTNCIPGRRFFIRIDNIPKFAKFVHKADLSQLYTYPWIAKISINYSEGSATCTGTLINDRYILTAQHCVYPPIEPQQVTVSLGTKLLYYKRNVKEYKLYTYYKGRATKIIFHPNFDMRNVETASNDLALIKIMPIQYSKTIYPIKLPSFSDIDITNSNTLADSIEWINEPSFSKTSVRVIDSESCNKFDLFYSQLVNKDVICTIELNDGMSTLKPTCIGNRGALLMIEDSRRIFNVTILAGIATWTQSKATPCLQNQNAAFYVKIYDKLLWIMSNTRDGLYCRY